MRCFFFVGEIFSFFQETAGVQQIYGKQIISELRHLEEDPQLVTVGYRWFLMCFPRDPITETENGNGT